MVVGLVPVQKGHGAPRGEWLRLSFVYNLSVPRWHELSHISLHRLESFQNHMMNVLKRWYGLDSALPSSAPPS